MTVHINGSKGKELYYNGVKIKEAYYNGNKVYSGKPLYYCYKITFDIYGSISVNYYYSAEKAQPGNHYYLCCSSSTTMATSSSDLVSGGNLYSVDPDSALYEPGYLYN